MTGRIFRALLGFYVRTGTGFVIGGFVAGFLYVAAVLILTLFGVRIPVPAVG